MTKQKSSNLKKFLLLFCLLVGYAAYLMAKYDFATGGAAAALTWSFFVLCTPIADAGFLLDFPLRLLFRIRMVISELFVWTFAIGLNIGMVSLSPQSYETTSLTRLFFSILTKPYPYWAIIFLSCVGTFLSIVFGDDVMDFFSKKSPQKIGRKKAFKKMGFLILTYGVTLGLYYFLIKEMGIDIS